MKDAVIHAGIKKSVIFKHCEIIFIFSLITFATLSSKV